MKPEECFCAIVNHLDFVFPLLQISHKSQDSLSSIGLAKDFFLW